MDATSKVICHIADALDDLCKAEVAAREAKLTSAAYNNDMRFGSKEDGVGKEIVADRLYMIYNELLKYRRHLGSM